MRKKERAEGVVRVLAEVYPDAGCSLNYSTPLQMLIATQLSAQCTDKRVNIITKDLFKKYPDAVSFANADYEELCRDIHSAGFYRNKAKNIIMCCRRILDVYGGAVPDTMDDLLTLPGTGRKTANLIMGDIFKKPAVVCDTHCMRLSKRIGLTKNDTPEKIEQDLKNLIPPEEQLLLCHRFVEHGREVCSARAPKCSICQIKEYCSFFEKNTK